ncbi:MAG TPA: LytTR family DNA-binding domain-containing protein [Candidatus Acidoferrum sp.]|nr:LytTR family DNA-binding domain-containing protein [Candidatus Acidoferrum sp.]
MRVLIVDDEPVEETALANILSARRDAEHLDSANDASEALDKLATNSYDVLLLDINMLDLSGTQLVDQLRERNLPLPSIVFVTAHVERAVPAFEKYTVDYVLKPFSNESINEALDRASRRAKGERAAKLIEALPQLSSPGHPMIAIKAKGRILFINPSDVVAVQAEGNYVSLQRESDSYLLRESISTVAEKLKPYGFIRIHRSALVNTSFVVEIKLYSAGKYGLRVKGGKEFAVTSGYKKNLKPLTEFRIGSGAFLAE